jgi:hypothetical protein
LVIWPLRPILSFGHSDPPAIPVIPSSGHSSHLVIPVILVIPLGCAGFAYIFFLLQSELKQIEICFTCSLQLFASIFSQLFAYFRIKSFFTSSKSEIKLTVKNMKPLEMTESKQTEITTINPATHTNCPRKFVGAALSEIGFATKKFQ